MAVPASKKILVPLSTLLVAGAVAVGSGATFTAESDNALSAVTSGTLTQSNSKADSAIFELTDLKPGDTLDGGLTVTNTGSLPATFTLTEVGSSNGFAGDNLTLEIRNLTTGEAVYSGAFGGLADGAANDLGVISAGTANEFLFRVALAESTPNADQGKSAGASYQWDMVQLDGEQFTQN